MARLFEQMAMVEPRFVMSKSADQTGAASVTWNKVTYEVDDISAGCSPDTTNDRVLFDKSEGVGTWDFAYNFHPSSGYSNNLYVRLYKNGSYLTGSEHDFKFDSVLNNGGVFKGITVALNDYFEIYEYHSAYTVTLYQSGVSAESGDSAFMGIRTGD